MSDKELGGQEAEESSAIHHDDIVKRLLEYQRQLREGATSNEAALQAGIEAPLIDYSVLEVQQAVATEAAEIVDLTAAEAEAEAGARAEVTPDIWTTSGLIEVPEGTAEPALPETPETGAAPASEGDLATRVTALEEILEDLVKDLHGLRTRSQDYALLVDDRLAAMQAKLAEATRGSATES